MSVMDHPDTAPSFAKAKPLKCFLVDGNDDPEDTMIVFAKSSIEAKRDWSNEHGDGPKFITGISTKRMPQWDAFAPGPVPRLELLYAGWWMECHGCGTKIDQDAIGWTIGLDAIDDDLSEYGPDLTKPIMEPYEPHAGAIWCHLGCHERDMRDRRRIKTLERRACNVIKAAVLRRYPGVTIVDRPGMMDCHVYAQKTDGRYLVHSVNVRFEIPGMKHGGCSFGINDDKWRQARIEVQGPQMDYWLNRRRTLRPPMSERKRTVTLYVTNGDKDLWDAWQSEQKATA